MGGGVDTGGIGSGGGEVERKPARAQNIPGAQSLEKGLDRAQGGVPKVDSEIIYCCRSEIKSWLVL